jgi:hypothetical protein
MLINHKSAVETKLVEYRNQPLYWAKYAWVASYHNFFCDQYNYFSDEHKIDIDKFGMQLTRII